MLCDLDIRSALTRELEDLYGPDPDAIVVEELGILGGANRMDVAVINGRLEGFEIKSDRDTLDRLAGQAAAYGRVFDRVTLVCTERHAEIAGAAIPEWWGIRIASDSVSGVRISQRRRGRLNREIDPDAVVQLLWRDEALDELEGRKLARGLRSKPKRDMWDALAASVATPELCRVARERMRLRPNWRSARQPCADGAS